MSTLHDDDIRTIGETGASTQQGRRRRGRHGLDRRRRDRHGRRRRRHGRDRRRRRRQRFVDERPEAALARCLDPVSADTFFAEHWEQRPLVVPRDEPGRFDDLLSEADIERLVCSTAIRYPAFPAGARGWAARRRLLHRRHPLAARLHEGGGRPNVLREREAGATIVLQALHVELAAAGGLLPAARSASASAFRPTPTTRRAARRGSPCLLTPTTCSSSRWPARSAGSSTTRCSSSR